MGLRGAERNIAAGAPHGGRAPDSLGFSVARGAILVVDDEPSILNTLKKALTLEGYAVDVAGGSAWPRSDSQRKPTTWCCST